MHQRAGLIVPGGGERDAEFDRCQRYALAQDGPRRIVGAYGVATALIFSRCFQFVDDAVNDIVLHRLVIRGDVSLLMPVEIGAAHFQRVLAERISDFLDDPFAAKHALRAAKAAKGRVGHRIGFHRSGGQPYIRQIVAIVCMKQRPVGHRPRKIGGKAASGGEYRVDRFDAAIIIISDVIIDVEIMALAGGDHIVVAIRADLDGTVVALCGNCGDRGKLVALGFLAAEAAAHAPREDRDRVGHGAERMRNHVLNFAGMLRRGIDRHLVILAGNGHRDMALQIEMILAADPHLTRQKVRRIFQRPVHITIAQRQRVGDMRIVGRHRAYDIRLVRMVFIIDFRKLRRTAGGVPRFGDDGEDRLTEKGALAIGQNRFVMACGRAEIVCSGNVGCGQYTDDARRRPHPFKIHTRDGGTGALGQSEIGMQHADRLIDVIDIFGRSGDVFVRRIMLSGRMDAPGNLRRAALLNGHRHASARTRSWRVTCTASPLVSSRKRLSRFLAVSIR